MALVVVDTNLISLLVKLKHGKLRKDEERAKRYEAYLQGHDMIRAFPTEAELHVRNRSNPKREAQLNDTWIAACALAHGLPLVTDNGKDFAWMQESVGLKMVCYSGT